MPRNLEEFLKKEVSVEDFKKMKFRGKLKCYAYDWACYTVFWPGYIGLAGAFVNLYLIKGNRGSIDYSPGNIFTSLILPAVAGAAVVSALRTGYRITRDYRMIKKIKK